jgi:hypothetical protein
MQINLDYGDILTDSWRIAWRNRGLWLLGILAACANGGGNFNTGSGNFGQDAGNIPGEGVNDFLRFLEQNAGLIIAIVIGVICLVVVINLIALALGFIGRGGLIGGARLAQAQGSVSFAQGWGEGTRHLGRLFGLWVITGLPQLIVGLLIAAGVVLFVFQIIANAPGSAEEAIAAQVFGLLACLVPLACILVLAGIALNILNHMGTLAAVSEDLSGLSALRRGWEVLRGNALALVILGAILWVLHLVIGLIAALPLVLAVVPVIASGIASAALEDPNFIGGGLIFAALCCVVYLPVLLVINGILEAWSWSAWALSYDKLTRPAIPPAPLTPEVPPPPPVIA